MTSRRGIEQDRSDIAKECRALEIGLQATLCAINAYKTKALDPYHSSYDKAYFSTKNMFAVFEKIIEHHIPDKIAIMHLKIRRFSRVTQSSSPDSIGSLVLQLNQLEQKLSHSQNSYLPVKEFVQKNYKSSVWDSQFQVKPETLYSDLTYCHIILHWDMYIIIFIINALHKGFKGIHGSGIPEIKIIVAHISHCFQQFNHHVSLIKKLIDEEGVSFLTSDQLTELSKNHIHSTHEDLLIAEGLFQTMKSDLLH